MVLFGPRWLVAIPLGILLSLAAALQSRHSLLPLIPAALIVFGPFMGLSLPLGKIRSPAYPVIRVLTCNLNAGHFNERALASLIQESRVDIVALQECPRELRLGIPPGWRILREGELAVLSRYPLRQTDSVQALHPPHQWPRSSLLCSVVEAPGGDVAFCTVHLPSPRYGLQNVLDRATLLSLSRRGLLNEETAHRRKTAQEVKRAVDSLSLPIIVAGDFNMPVESAIYREFWGGYANAFSRAGFGYGLTQWVAVRGIKQGVRIDHVLTGSGLVPSLCETGPNVGSDHLPVIADICRWP